MKWNSPFQTRRYATAVQKTGVDVAIYDEPLVIADRLHTNALTAWQTDLDTRSVAKHLDVYNFCGIAYWDEVAWEKDAFYTLVVERGNVSYSSSRRRNIRKAQRNRLKHAITIGQSLGEVLGPFQTSSAFRSSLPESLFSELTRNYVQCGAAEVHTVSSKLAILSAAVVLYSQDVANIRYIASTPEGRALQATALLYDGVIRAFLDRGCMFTDLSGVTNPATASKGEAGINRYKRGFSELVAVFKKWDEES